MSHFTKCDLQIKNLAALKRALEDLNLEYKAAEQGQSVEVRGWKGQILEATMSIDMGQYDIGVVAGADGTYELTADWWGIETTKGITEEQLQGQLKQKYAYHNVKMACEEKGYSVEEEVNQEDGTIQLVMRKWG